MALPQEWTVMPHLVFPAELEFLSWAPLWLWQPFLQMVILPSVQVVTDQMPFKECYPCIPPHMCDNVKAHLQEMLDIGAILKSHSPWASAVVLIWKKDGSLRFCINLRKLNNWTINDAYSLPHRDETLDSLQGSQWVLFTWPEVGLLAGQDGQGEQTIYCIYHGAVGLLWVKWCILGSPTPPPTFQRWMDTCPGDVNLHWCNIYLDDIVNFSKDHDSHLERLEAMFQKLEEAGLKLNPSKCELSWWQIAYLGHIVSAQGIVIVWR